MPCLSYIDSKVDIAYIDIASPTQLRTATAYGVKSKRTTPVSTMAKDNPAVIAMNGDFFSKDPGQKGYEVRMTEMVTESRKRNRIYHKQDELIIDKNGDLVVCFDEYEVAPGSMGTVSFKIPKSVYRADLHPEYR